jgi:Family of unknown function (DUF6158)
MTDGVDPAQLDDEALLRELEQLYRTRLDTLRHGSDQAVRHSGERLNVLEAEYVRRRPEREVEPDRLRSGVRVRAGQDPE